MSGCEVAEETIAGVIMTDLSIEEAHGGERGIRTPDTLSGIRTFQARAFNHSAISPFSFQIVVLPDNGRPNYKKGEAAVLGLDRK